jgi:hypothetical protein
MELAKENISQIDSVIEEPLEKCLMYLAYRADKILMEDLLHKEALKKMG